jgi:hypothetical protein
MKFLNPVRMRIFLEWWTRFFNLNLLLSSGCFNHFILIPSFLLSTPPGVRTPYLTLASLSFVPSGRFICSPQGRINSGIESSSCDSVNKNKRFVGGNPCLSNFIFLYFLFLTPNVRRGCLFHSCVPWLFVMFVQDCPRFMMTLMLVIFSSLGVSFIGAFWKSYIRESYRLTFSLA